MLVFDAAREIYLLFLPSGVRAWSPLLSEGRGRRARWQTSRGGREGGRKGGRMSNTATILNRLFKKKKKKKKGWRGGRNDLP